ncbi:MAG: acetylxylan esterase, partial [Bryobacteraceae bacterium]
MHIIIGRFAVSVALCASCTLAQDWEREVRALRPASTAASEQALLDYLENRVKTVLDAIPHASTPAQAAAERPVLRRQLELSLGFRRLPAPDPQPRVVGTLQRDGYRIEKLVYHSLPGVSVPAHLYLPANLTGPAPAILFYTGHWYPDSKARPDFQAFCINMARQGFVVLIFDTFGQGERGISTRDHRRVELLLAGVAQQGLAAYETQCALAVLTARPEVDPDRIGMTGASGGGYNTWITSALDDRIKVAVPVVGTSDFLEQIQVTRALDWYHADEHCHFVPGLI